MYRVDGSSDLSEETLDHLDGWRGSKPVRIGNGAADQLQLDIYGEAMDALYLGVNHGVVAAMIVLVCFGLVGLGATFLLPKNQQVPASTGS